MPIAATTGSRSQQRISVRFPRAETGWRVAIGRGRKRTGQCAPPGILPPSSSMHSGGAFALSPVSGLAAVGAVNGCSGQSS